MSKSLLVLEGEKEESKEFQNIIVVVYILQKYKFDRIHEICKNAIFNSVH